CTCLPTDVNRDKFMCAADSNCFEGFTCVAQRCVPMSMSTGCTDGQKSCGDGGCIELTSCCGDSDCSVTGQLCTAGTCACPRGQEECLGACQDAATPCTAPATKLVFASAPQTVAAGACSAAIIVETHDAVDNPVGVRTQTTVSLAEQGMLSVQVFSDPACMTA